MTDTPTLAEQIAAVRCEIETLQLVGIHPQDTLGEVHLEALRAALATLEASAWRPIDEAPKDGDGLSKTARALWERVQNPRNWYRPYGPRVPKAMQELVDAGLVKTAGRVAVVQACYVPVGFQPYKSEVYPGIYAKLAAQMDEAASPQTVAPRLSERSNTDEHKTTGVSRNTGEDHDAR